MNNDNDNDNDRLLTREEALKLFANADISESTFNNRVKAKKITGVLPEGKTRGALYSENQVLAAITMTKKGKAKRKIYTKLEPTIFRKATTEDMPEIATLLETFFKAKINVEKRAAWIERNPEVVYILQCKEKLVGCAFVMPFSEEKIMNILGREVQPPTRPGDILLYESGKPVNEYIRSVVVLQGVSKKQRKHWAARLIIGLIKAIIELGSRGIIIEKIYSQGDTKAGERALKMLGFTQIISQTEHKNFVLDLATSGTSLAIKYRKALNAWRELHDSE